MWMNVTCLVGRATAEPKARETTSGTKYATLRIAVPRGRQQTDFFTVELWGKLATVATNLVEKGTLVSVRCELKQQAWVANGQRRERIILAVRTLGVIKAPMTFDELTDEHDTLTDDDILEFSVENTSGDEAAA
jgi:single-strand DNA-binding protein